MSKYITLFFIILTGNIIAHYICKWLEKKHNA